MAAATGSALSLKSKLVEWSVQFDRQAAPASAKAPGVSRSIDACPAYRSSAAPTKKNAPLARPPSCGRRK